MSGNGRTKIHTAAFAAALAGAAFAIAQPAHAEDIYRSIGSDGKVTYSSQPVPGARETTVIDVETLSPEQRRATLLLRLKDEAISAEVSRRIKTLDRAWTQADAEVSAAQKGLADAERALRKGRVPLAQYWRGNLHGGARLSQDYFDRLKRLEKQVEEARARLNKAYDARNALK